MRGDNKRNQAWLINGPVALVSKWKKIMLDWDNRWNHWNLRVDRVKLNDTSSIQFSGPNSITLDFKISSSSSFFRHKSIIFIPIFNLFFFVREQGVYFSFFILSVQRIRNSLPHYNLMEQLEIVDVNWDQQERCEMVGREHRMAPYLLRNPFLTCQGIVFRSGRIIIP